MCDVALSSLLDLLDDFPEIRPPATDLCPLWRLEPPGVRHDCDLLLRVVAWCDCASVARKFCPDYGPGEYVLASPGGEVIARFTVEEEEEAAHAATTHA